MFCIQGVSKCKTKSFKNKVFNTLCFPFVSSFKSFFKWQCPISIIYPDTNHIKQGDSILEYLPFWLLKTLDNYIKHQKDRFTTLFFISLHFRCSFPWRWEFICFRNNTNLFCLQSLNDDVMYDGFNSKFQTIPCCLKKSRFLCFRNVLHIYF